MRLSGQVIDRLRPVQKSSGTSCDDEDTPRIHWDVQRFFNIPIPHQDILLGYWLTANILEFVDIGRISVSFEIDSYILDKGFAKGSTREPLRQTPNHPHRWHTRCPQVTATSLGQFDTRNSQFLVESIGRYSNFPSLYVDLAGSMLLSGRRFHKQNYV